MPRILLAFVLAFVAPSCYRRSVSHCDLRLLRLFFAALLGVFSGGAYAAREYRFETCLHLLYLTQQPLPQNQNEGELKREIIETWVELVERKFDDSFQRDGGYGGLQKKERLLLVEDFYRSTNPDFYDYRPTRKLTARRFEGVSQIKNFISDYEALQRSIQPSTTARSAVKKFVAMFNIAGVSILMDTPWRESGLAVLGAYSAYEFGKTWLLGRDGGTRRFLNHLKEAVATPKLRPGSWAHVSVEGFVSEHDFRSIPREAATRKETYTVRADSSRDEFRWSLMVPSGEAGLKGRILVATDLLAWVNEWGQPVLDVVTRADANYWSREPR